MHALNQYAQVARDVMRSTNTQNQNENERGSVPNEHLRAWAMRETRKCILILTTLCVLHSTQETFALMANPSRRCLSRIYTGAHADTEDSVESKQTAYQIRVCTWRRTDIIGTCVFQNLGAIIASTTHVWINSGAISFDVCPKGIVHLGNHKTMWNSLACARKESG